MGLGLAFSVSVRKRGRNASASARRSLAPWLHHRKNWRNVRGTPMVSKAPHPLSIQPPLDVQTTLARCGGARIVVGAAFSSF